MTRITNLQEILGKTVNAASISSRGYLVIGFDDGTFIVATGSSDNECSHNAATNIRIDEESYARSGSTHLLTNYMSAQEALDGGFISKALYDVWLAYEQRAAIEQKKKRAAALQLQIQRLQAELETEAA